MARLLLLSTLATGLMLLLVFLEILLQVFQVENLHVYDTERLPRMALGFLRYSEPCIPPHQDIRIKRLTQYLRDFDQAAQSIKLKYWLDFGTLLGAHRSGKIIAWDHDSDVGVLKDEFMGKFNQLEVILKARGYVLTVKSGCRYMVSHEQPATQMTGQLPAMLDIFMYVPMTGASGNGTSASRTVHSTKLGRESSAERTLTRCDIIDKARYAFSEHYIQRLEPITLEGLKTYAPQQRGLFLANRYPLTHRITIPYRINCYLEGGPYFILFLAVVAVAVILFAVYFFAIAVCLQALMRSTICCLK